MLAKYNEIRLFLKSKLNMDYCLTYETLVAIRDDNIALHCGAFNAMIILGNCDNNEEVLSYVLIIADALRNQGYEVALESGGYMKIYLDNICLNTWIAWIRNKKFYLYFSIVGTIDEDDIYPLAYKESSGGKILVMPNNPEKVIAQIYGEKHLNIDRPFNKNKEEKLYFSFLDRINIEEQIYYWNNYYVDRENKKEAPSQFATFAAAKMNSGKKLLEFGAGTGRDSLFFANSGFEVMSVDGSSKAIEWILAAQSREGLFFNTKVLNMLDYENVREFERLCTGYYDYVYARFFIHAIPYRGQMNFVRLANRCLKTEGKLFLEFRTIDDEYYKEGIQLSINERFSNHYRRFLQKEDVVFDLECNGFICSYSQTQKGWAKYGDEDPLVGRIIAIKNTNTKNE